MPQRPDNAKNEDYFKTVIWIVRGRAIKGTITQKSSGEIGFDGEFSTPRSPNGKPASDLDDVEKADLKALLENEKPAADALEKKRFPGLEEERQREKRRLERNRPH